MENAASTYKKLIFPDGVASTSSLGFSVERAMLDASPDCIKVISLDGNVIALNKAGCLALGVPAGSPFGMPWLPLLPASVHAAGAEAIAAARQGRNARFPGLSEQAGETRYWDNLLTPVADEEGRVRAILCVSRDVTANTLLERELESALMREQLLSQEMRHRIKNVFAVVSGLIGLSEKEAADRDAPEGATGLLREKLAALARASDAVFEPKGIGAADRDSVEVGLIVGSVLRPYADSCSAEGGPCAIPRRCMTAIVLFLHELATNSVKYGALSADGGAVRVGWRVDAAGLLVSWVERGGPLVSGPPRQQGFGGDMLDRVAKSVNGSITRAWAPEGLSADLLMPIS